MNEKLNPSHVLSIIREAVEIEKEFIIDALPCKLIGMNSILMTQYIEFVADKLLRNLGMEKFYNVSNPFSFMERISIDAKTNFFESRTSQYQKSNIMSKPEERVFSLDDIF